MGILIKSRNPRFEVDPNLGVQQRHRIFFFRGKVTHSTHSLVLKISGIFFFPIRQKKIQRPEIQKIQKFGQKFQKIMLLVTIDFEFRKITNSQHVIQFFGKNGDRGYT